MTTKELYEELRYIKTDLILYTSAMKRNLDNAMETFEELSMTEFLIYCRTGKFPE